MFLGMGTALGALWCAPSDALDADVVVSLKNVLLALEEPSQPRQHVMQKGKCSLLGSYRLQKHKVSAELVAKTSSSN